MGWFFTKTLGLVKYLPTELSTKLLAQIQEPLCVWEKSDMGKIDLTRLVLNKSKLNIFILVLSNSKQKIAGQCELDFFQVISAMQESQ